MKTKISKDNLIIACFLMAAIGILVGIYLYDVFL